MPATPSMSHEIQIFIAPAITVADVAVRYYTARLAGKVTNVTGAGPGASRRGRAQKSPLAAAGGCRQRDGPRL
jgi:hypothetical protein